MAPSIRAGHAGVMDKWESAQSRLRAKKPAINAGPLGLGGSLGSGELQARDRWMRAVLGLPQVVGGLFGQILPRPASSSR